MNLRQWTADYFDLRGTRLKPSTMRIYRESARHMIAAWGEDRDIGTITRLEAAKLRAALIPGRSENTVCKLVAACQSIMGEAARVDLIPFSPFDRESLARPRMARKWAEITADQLERILVACPTDEWRCCFGLARYAALRIGEIRRLRWGDIDFDRRSIEIVPEGRQVTTKQSARTVPLTPRLAPLLFRAYTTSPIGLMGPCAKLPAQSYRPAVAIIRAAGLEPWRNLWHALRKSQISEWGSACAPRDVAAWSGHDEAVAREHYHHTPKATWDQITQPPTSQ